MQAVSGFKLLKKPCFTCIASKFARNIGLDVLLLAFNVLYWPPKWPPGSHLLQIFCSSNIFLTKTWKYLGDSWSVMIALKLAGNIESALPLCSIDLFWYPRWPPSCHLLQIFCVLEQFLNENSKTPLPSASKFAGNLRLQISALLLCSIDF